MRIGIDIDDTITNTWNDIIPYYSREFGVPIEVLKKSKPYYESVKDLCTREEYFERIKPIYNNVAPMVSLKEDVCEVLNDLRSKGHTITFISSRGEGYTDAYNLTKEYLNKMGVPYDRLIVGASRNKDYLCVSEKIDLFIDDSYKHCVNASKLGVRVLMSETDYNKECLEFPRLKKWKDIYKFIGNR